MVGVPVIEHSEVTAVHQLGTIIYRKKKSPFNAMHIMICTNIHMDTQSCIYMCMYMYTMYMYMHAHATGNYKEITL